MRNRLRRVAPSLLAFLLASLGTATVAEGQNRQALLRQAENHLQAHDPVRARSTLKKLGEGSDPAILMMEGRILEQEGDYDAAVRRFDDAAAKAPEDPEPLVHKGETLLHANREGPANQAFTAAKNRAQKRVGAEPDNAEARYLLGVAQQRLGQHEAAFSTFEKALKLAPGDARIQYRMGLTRLLQRQWQAAVDLTSRSLEKNGRLAYAYYVRGTAAGQVGRKDMMINDLKRFLELAPDAPEADRARKILSSVKG